MSKIILKNKLTNETMEFEGSINVIPDSWELIKEEKKKNGSPKQKANGDGSFYYSETLGKWVGQYGRKTVTQRKNESKTDCKKRWEDLKSKIKNGTYIEKSNDTLYILLKRNIEQKYKDGTTNGSSYIRNSYTLKELTVACSNFIYKPIQKVTIEDVEDAKDAIRDYSSESINKMWGMLKLGFKIASSSSRRLITFNIMEDVTLKKPISKKQKKKKEALTIKEEQSLKEILNNEEKEHPYRDIVLMQLYTGMRIGEVLTRTLDDFNLKESTLHIWNTVTRDKLGNFVIGEHTKNYNKALQIDKGERTIPINNEVKSIIEKIKKSNFRNIHNLIFWDYKNNCLITYKEINSWLKRLNVKYRITNKSLSSHILRHTKITRMREAGISLPVIQYSVGQVEGSDVTDEVYVTVSPDFVNSELKKANMI